MPLPPRLEQELNELRLQHRIEVIEEAELINLIFLGFAIGDGYTVAHSDLLLRVPRSYADAGPDMFWTIPEVLLANGQVPQAADSKELHVGREWRRFSWHRPQSSPWNPNVDNLQSNLEFIRKRLGEKK
jgi:hypothetical protein